MKTVFTVAELGELELDSAALLSDQKNTVEPRAPTPFRWESPYLFFFCFFMLKETTQEQFQKDVLENDKLVLVDFWAPWCGPCKQMLPIVEEVSKQYSEDTVCFYKLNADEAKEITSRFSIRSVPTIMIFKDGMFYGQLTGVKTISSIKELIDSNI